MLVALLIFTVFWDVPCSNLAPDVDSLVALNAFPHSFQAASRSVGLP